MSPEALKGVGVGCFVACAILLVVAWDRYQDNANQVEAANKMLQGPEGMIGPNESWNCVKSVNRSRLV